MILLCLLIDFFFLSFQIDKNFNGAGYCYLKSNTIGCAFTRNDVYNDNKFFYSEKKYSIMYNHTQIT